MVQVNMKEEFFHHLWKYCLFDRKDLKTSSGEILIIDKPGEHNSNAGPDFFNAKLRIDDTLWVGNVEVHINSSDWYLHKHQIDKAYDNVVLHVVFNHDQQVKRSSGEIIPTLELKGKFDSALIFKFDKLLHSSLWIPCQENIKQTNTFIIDAWMERLFFERLERKTHEIQNELQKNKNNWQETFYFFLARSFGFKINAEPFELLAKSLPLSYLLKHKESLFQIQALLFGQAGLLEKEFNDAFPIALKKEYHFLKKKYNLQPLDLHLWKFLRLRPVNFPTLRIALFSKLIHQCGNLFSNMINTSCLEELYAIFNVSADEYWDSHYVFDKASIKLPKSLGKAFCENILINTIIPFLFLYGKTKDEASFQETAIKLMEKIPGEKNSIILKWEQLSMKTQTAFQTQALLELKKQYCTEKKCLNCSIGINMLKTVIHD